VSGGNDNHADGPSTVVCGGIQNNINAAESSILGGKLNSITGYLSTEHSMVFGLGVSVSTSDRVVFYDGDNPGRFGINRDDSDGGLSYPIHVGTSTSNGNGAYLTEGGTWSDGSSREYKENFTPLDGETVLDKISELPVESWNYKGTDERHIGPVAEDFVAAFDVGPTRVTDGQRDNKYLASKDVAGVALVGVQELVKENKKLKELIFQLQQDIEELKAKK